MRDLGINPPQTTAEIVGHCREIVAAISNLHFQLAAWVVELLDHHNYKADVLADDLNMSKTRVYELAAMRRFWITDGLPSDLVVEINGLHEIRKHSEALNYTWFRQARRAGRSHKELDRAGQVWEAVKWLKSELDNNHKHSVMEASAVAIAGQEPFQGMTKRLTLTSREVLPTDDIVTAVMAGISLLEEEGKRWQIAVYEVHGDD
jgi:hypothetical protein